jgi:alkylhydroperoxidase family enzyme
VVTTNLTGFVSKQDDGALLGPFNPILHFPHFGAPAWELTVALAKHSNLPKSVKEVAILVIGARHKAQYEIYAHERVAKSVGLSVQKIATLCAGQRPPDLTEAEGIGYDVAAALMSGGPLPEPCYRASVAAFGEDGSAELIFLIANYSLVSVLLNAYDIPVPEHNLT